MKKLPIILTIMVMGIIGFSITASAADSAIPEWIKNNAKWWSEGSITETDYIKSLEYLIVQGVIQIPIPIAEVTAAQTPLSDDERAQSFVVRFHDGMIEKPFVIDTFIKFEATSSQPTEGGFPATFPIYTFRDDPEFMLESLPSADKQDLYRGSDRWMTKSAPVTPFDVDIEVLSGSGQIIQTWAYKSCQPTAYGTFVQDLIFYYQFVDQE
ncbi:MAG: hypothetical protein IIC67_12215, partial [Thaumarchaeota archaeon]|nr:hypothetical protein [Nitrososphaerota archaeon]